VNPEQWKKIEQIYNEALEYSPEARSFFIAKACGEDKELRREVESLIQANAGEFLELPAAEFAAKAMARSVSAAGTERLQPGTKFGPYQITARIGRGGMGEVYRATDTRLQRTVAVKILLEAFSTDSQRRERFEREARAISRLNHPHICTLHDVGEQDGIYYFVMEFVEGETLASRLKRGPLPLDQLLEYLIQIAAALEEAHLQGVVHRDLKPENIMLTKSGVKLLDFGLAKLKSDKAAVSGMSPVSSRDLTLTTQGTILGTLQYMAPEQLEGKDADGRTDIFAFGAIAYEMVTGEKAFEGKSQASLIAAIMNQEPQPMTRREALVPPLDQIIRKCLAKNPLDRCQTAGDLTREIRRLTSRRHAWRPSLWSTRFNKRFAVTSLVVFLIVAAQGVRAHLSGDPFILIYLVATLLVSSFFSLVIVAFQGQNQKHMAFAAFFILGTLVAGAVWWRYIDLQYYLSDPVNLHRPAGFCYGHWGFIPYFTLLGSWIVFMTYLTYSHTREGINKENQRPILIAFTILIVSLFGCRLVWESMESKGLERLRQDPTIELNCSTLKK